MDISAGADGRVVCAVLAAQVAAIRDRVDTASTVDLLGRTGDLLTQLAGLIAELLGHRSDLDPGLVPAGLRERCSAALRVETEISQSLDDVAFLQAQQDDFARQMANCVVGALEHMATVQALPTGGSPLPYDLVASYVSEEQRKVHEAVTRQFEIDASRNARAPLGLTKPGR
jgi:hypothetical protein